MKTLIPPTLAALLCTGCTVVSCLASGMRQGDLAIAGAVAFLVSASVAYTFSWIRLTQQPAARR